MKQTENKFLIFLKRNALYLILAFCVIAVGVSVTLMLVKRQNDLSASVDAPVIEKPGDSTDGEQPSDSTGTPDDGDGQPVDAPITFLIPVENPTSIGEYSETMVFNSTLNRFSTHLAIDFFADEGTKVFSAYEGIVENVENTLLKGTTITINHGNGLKTVYNSLLDGDSVTVGQKVMKGDLIGSVSVSNRQEAGSGAHLHFEVIEDGKNVDPLKYLEISEK
jgi:murein DD-endopeptidase MepM/ murein hydrolase activator NlpD